MEKSKVISDMYFKAFTEKMCRIGELDKYNEEVEEMKKQFGCSNLFDELIEHNKKKKERLLAEYDELYIAWRQSNE